MIHYQSPLLISFIFDSHHLPDYFSSKSISSLFLNSSTKPSEANTLSYPNAVNSIFLFVKTPFVF